jgi:hypothetical protein
MTIRPVGDELLHADRLLMKLVVAFRNSAKAAKNADTIRAIRSCILHYVAVFDTECRVSMVGGDWGKMNWKDVKICGMIQNRYHPGKCVDRLRKTEKP